MGMICNNHERNEKCTNNFNHETRNTWRANVPETDLRQKKKGRDRKLDSSGLGNDPVVGIFKYGNKPYGCIIPQNFLINQFSNYQFLRSMHVVSKLVNVKLKTPLPHRGDNCVISNIQMSS
jgi:hypothetical protein